MEKSALLGNKPFVDSIATPYGTRVAYFRTLASVISLIDVTIRAFSSLLTELGFLCHFLLASCIGQANLIYLTKHEKE